jgi:hypothetical protein
MGGVWSGKRGAEGGIGNPNNDPNKRLSNTCPVGTFVNTIGGSGSDSVANISMRCSDGTSLGQMGPGSLTVSKNCPKGFYPKTTAAGFWVDGVTLGCIGDDKSNFTIGYVGGSAHTCPDGYGVTGMRGGWGSKAVGSIEYQCAPRTDDAIKTCCEGNTVINCREYSKDSEACKALEDKNKAIAEEERKRLEKLEMAKEDEDAKQRVADEVATSQATTDVLSKPAETSSNMPFLIGGGLVLVCCCFAIVAMWLMSRNNDSISTSVEYGDE